MKKKIIVTAPTSTVAKNFISFVKDEYDIITLGRRESDIKYDFCSRKELILPDGVSSIVHFAGVLRASTDDETLNMVDVNVRGILELCMAAKRALIEYVINISSINATIPEESPYWGYYSLSKKQGEEMGNLFCKKEGIKLCNIRPSQIFGCDMDYSKTQPLLYLMLASAARDEDICIYGKKDVTRNYIFSDNLFSLIKEVIEKAYGGQ